MNDLFPSMIEEKIETVADIAVPIPVTGLFSYRIPSEFKEQLKPGVRVLVPFRNREMTGYLVAMRQTADTAKLKPILEVLDTEPVLSAKMLELTEWVGRRYLSSWGEAIENALPKWVKFGKRAQKAWEKETGRLAKQKAGKLGDGEKGEKERTTGGLGSGEAKDLVLSEDQQKAMQAISEELNRETPKPILIHGVTGSGKSEIYIRAIREVLSLGKTAICLVPEIALTEQIKRFFYAHFGDQLEILHSRLTDSERFLAWKRIEQGMRRVILGPRSAVFAPLSNLGLIIMDEEHEGTYKQETVPRYHAREVAQWRAFNEKALFVMGTATPSLEATFRAGRGDYRLIEMKTRIDDKPLPEVEIVDLKDERMTQRKNVILSRRLVIEIEKNLQAGEGTMLLLNRRGFSTQVCCTESGEIQSCPSCQVSLTFHQQDSILLCHYCNYQKKIDQTHNARGEALLNFSGFGTEKVESEVARRWPGARVSRMDMDSVKKQGSHEAILKDFRDKKIDILIGTQMIAKGFDFPHVTLVGVVLADVGLSLPDFRSAERTFQLLTQVAGRAGRGERKGRVVIQTFSPDHPSVRFAQKHDHFRFYEYEVPIRKTYHYPPEFRLVNFIVRSKDEKKAYLFTLDLRNALKERLEQNVSDTGKGIEVMTPAPLPFYKLRGHFRWHVMVKIPGSDQALEWLREAMLAVKKPSSVQAAIDVDPLSIL